MLMISTLSGRVPEAAAVSAAAPAACVGTPTQLQKAPKLAHAASSTRVRRFTLLPARAGIAPLLRHARFRWPRWRPDRRWCAPPSGCDDRRAPIVKGG